MPHTMPSLVILAIRILSLGSITLQILVQACNKTIISYHLQTWYTVLVNSVVVLHYAHKHTNN